MTRTRRARRLSGRYESSDPARDTSRWRLPGLRDDRDREAARLARSLATGDGRSEAAETDQDGPDDQPEGRDTP